MRIWTVSDLHLRPTEIAELVPPPGGFPDADLCVVAGDVGDGLAGLGWVAKVIRPMMPVVLVLGNHDMYGHSVPSARKVAKLTAEAFDCVLLDDDEVVIDGVRFLGGTLWTDYALFSRPEDGEEGRQAAVRTAMAAARRSLDDHLSIDATEVVEGVMSRRFLPQDAAALHAETRAFIERELKKPHDGPTVVVTHHAPHPGSISPRFKRDPVTPAFVSDLSGLIEAGNPTLWIHGHVHHACDYRVGATRIVCNPRGYSRESADFDWWKVVEV